MLLFNKRGVKIWHQSRKGGYLSGRRAFYPHPRLSCLLGSPERALAVPENQRWKGAFPLCSRRFMCKNAFEPGNGYSVTSRWLLPQF